MEESANNESVAPKPEKGKFSGYFGTFMMFLLAPGALVSLIYSCLTSISCTRSYSLGCTYVLFFEWIIFGAGLAVTFLLLLVSLINRNRPIHKKLWKVELAVFIALLIALVLSIIPDQVRMYS
jgi:hypothetical protein